MIGSNYYDGVIDDYREIFEEEIPVIQLFTHSIKGQELPISEDILNKRIYIHTTFNTIPLNPWSVKYFEAQLEVAKKIKAKGIIIHLPSNLEKIKLLENRFISTLKKYFKLLKNDSPIIYFEHVVGDLTHKDKFLKVIEDIKKISKEVSKTTKQTIDIRPCMDTCHIFSSGVELDEYKGMTNTLLHLNDSVYEFGSGRDRHASLGDNIFSPDKLKTLLSENKFDDIIIELKDSKASFEYLKKLNI